MSLMLFVMDTFRMIRLDPRWCLPSKVADNPMVWMLSANGVLMDIRHAPREAQVEALRKGMIPYLSETGRNQQ